MSDEEQRRIFSKNLNHYLEISEKTQKEVADAIGVAPQTFNTWCMGVAIPRMGKVQKLADYFGIQKSDLIDEKPVRRYYINDETAKAAQEMLENKELHALFDVERNMSPEELRAVYGMIMALKKEENKTDDSGY